MYDEKDLIDEDSLFEHKRCSPELRRWLRELPPEETPIVEEVSEPPLILNEELEEQREENQQ